MQKLETRTFRDNATDNHGYNGGTPKRNSPASSLEVLRAGALISAHIRAKASERSASSHKDAQAIPSLERAPDDIGRYPAKGFQ